MRVGIEEFATALAQTQGQASGLPSLIKRGRLVAQECEQRPIGQGSIRAPNVAPRPVAAPKRSRSIDAEMVGASIRLSGRPAAMTTDSRRCSWGSQRRMSRPFADALRLHIRFIGVRGIASSSSGRPPR